MAATAPGAASTSVLPGLLAPTVEESRELRLQKQQARFRDRGGIFVPSEKNPLLEELLSKKFFKSPAKANDEQKSAGTESPSKGKGKGKGKAREGSSKPDQGVAGDGVAKKGTKTPRTPKSAKKKVVVVDDAEAGPSGLKPCTEAPVPKQSQKPTRARKGKSKADITDEPPAEDPDSLPHKRATRGKNKPKGVEVEETQEGQEEADGSEYETKSKSTAPRKRPAAKKTPAAKPKPKAKPKAATTRKPAKKRGAKDDEEAVRVEDEDEVEKVVDSTEVKATVKGKGRAKAKAKAVEVPEEEREAVKPKIDASGKGKTKEVVVEQVEDDEVAVIRRPSRARKKLEVAVVEDEDHDQDDEGGTSSSKLKEPRQAKVTSSKTKEASSNRNVLQDHVEAAPPPPKLRTRTPPLQKAKSRNKAPAVFSIQSPNESANDEEEVPLAKAKSSRENDGVTVKGVGKRKGVVDRAADDQVGEDVDEKGGNGEQLKEALENTFRAQRNENVGEQNRQGGGADERSQMDDPPLPKVKPKPKKPARSQPQPIIETLGESEPAHEDKSTTSSGSRKRTREGAPEPEEHEDGEEEDTTRGLSKRQRTSGDQKLSVEGGRALGEGGDGDGSSSHVIDVSKSKSKPKPKTKPKTTKPPAKSRAPPQPIIETLGEHPSSETTTLQKRAREDESEDAGNSSKRSRTVVLVDTNESDFDSDKKKESQKGSKVSHKENVQPPAQATNKKHHKDDDDDTSKGKVKLKTTTNDKSKERSVADVIMAKRILVPRASSPWGRGGMDSDTDPIDFLS
ncbi:hypothetical protein JAAARDRAFT_314433 [Jaapia argillacea MUCL 33604]|uniref:Uncharacterized protein n=1 Tax=Jaapia argillacea MUCL 33604 TaxID=933084 RepID=A0A067Q019_9AGAM|nr:hypothetical protein JAAARDRAFT_314433 [Jaapia argillacea MUCL 33604]